jgi:hypothetical protein
MEKVRERLAVKKQRQHRLYMERFSLKKLNVVEGKKAVLRSQIGLQLWKIWKLRWILLVLGKVLEYQNVSQKESRLL